MMGYYTDLESSLRVLERQDIPDGWEDFNDHGFYGCLRFDSIWVETLEDDVKAYDIDDELQDLVDKLPGASWYGYIEGHGEAYDDIWRLYVVDGKVQRATAVITFPEVPS